MATEKRPDPRVDPRTDCISTILSNQKRFDCIQQLERNRKYLNCGNFSSSVNITYYKELNSNLLPRHTNLSPLRKNRSFGIFTMRREESRSIVHRVLQLNGVMVTSIKPIPSQSV